MKRLDTIHQELIDTLANSEARLEAAIILEHVLGYSKTDLVTKSEKVISQSKLKRIFDIRDIRRDTKTPLAYILEEAPFMDMKLFVNSDVLIPRPETELLIEYSLAEIKKRRIRKARILDLCTGSGCLAIAMKRALPSATIYASDISKNALSVASINAKKHECKINFILGDYLDPFLDNPNPSIFALPIMKGPPPYFDLIITNPPYISESDYQSLEAELYHEPKHALVGFPYEHIKKQSQGLIKDNGFMAMEFGEGQSEKILELFPGARIIKDYAGIDRMAIT